MSVIEGRSVLVTGAAQGLGRQLAIACARRGARLTLWDLQAERLEEVVAEIGAHARFAPRGYTCDVADSRNVAELAGRVAADAGGIDILVNNAGVMVGRRLLDCSDRQIDRTLAVNLGALFWTTRAFLPAMIRAGRGHIVTIASAAGLLGVAGLVDYCASKRGAVGFDESLRMELRRIAPQLRTTLVCPYLIDTTLTEGVQAPCRWLMPPLRQEEVAARVVRAIESDQRRVVLPWAVNLLPALQLLPVALLDLLCDVAGVNRCMDSFAMGTSGDRHPDAL
jgi:all-trans-retinol dehydrogenase (NAD+)